MPSTPTDGAVMPARRRRLLTTLVVLTVGVVVVDQLTKAWALSALDDGARREVLGRLLGLQLVFNPGAALSIATGMTWLLTVIAVGVIVVVVRASRRLGSTLWAVALGLLLGGALGNLLDRLFRQPGVARGWVVDFIAYGNWFVGNVADIAIVVAAAMIVLLAATGVRLDGERAGADGDATTQGLADETSGDAEPSGEAGPSGDAGTAPAVDADASAPATPRTDG